MLVNPLFPGKYHQNAIDVPLLQAMLQLESPEFEPMISCHVLTHPPRKVRKVTLMKHYASNGGTGNFSSWVLLVVFGGFPWRSGFQFWQPQSSGNPETTGTTDSAPHPGWENRSQNIPKKIPSFLALLHFPPRTTLQPFAPSFARENVVFPNANPLLHQLSTAFVDPIFQKRKKCFLTWSWYNSKRRLATSTRSL